MMVAFLCIKENPKKAPEINRNYVYNIFQGLTLLQPNVAKQTYRIVQILWGYSAKFQEICT